MIILCLTSLQLRLPHDRSWNLPLSNWSETRVAIWTDFRFQTYWTAFRISGACPDIFDRGGTRGGPPLTGYLANHISRYWGGQSDLRGGLCHPWPLPEHATAEYTEMTSGYPEMTSGFTEMTSGFKITFYLNYCSGGAILNTLFYYPFSIWIKYHISNWKLRKPILQQIKLVDSCPTLQSYWHQQRSTVSRKVRQLTTNQPLLITESELSAMVFELLISRIEFLISKIQILDIQNAILDIQNLNFGYQQFIG